MPDINYKRNEMIVNDSGICKPIYSFGNYVGLEIVITKEAFIEAYNRYIKEAEE